MKLWKSGTLSAIAFPSQYGNAIFQNGAWSLPPIRYTPADLRRLTYDYFLWNYVPRSGDFIVDVGAGMGTELPVYSRGVGARGKVLAFEAHPKSFAIAVRMSARNRLRNVQIERVALWDSPGEIRLSDSADSLGINSAVDKNLLAGPTLLVPCAPLDSYRLFDGERDIDFLKLNVEGAELRVLRGALTTLPRVRNVCVSTHDFLASDKAGNEAMRTKRAVLELISDYGFTIHKRHDERPVIRDMIYASRSGKVL